MNSMLKTLGLIFSAIFLLNGCDSKSDQVNADFYIDFADKVSSEEIASNENTLYEFFSYGCIHCKNFAPLLENWLAEHPDVKVEYVPVAWNDTTELYANMYHVVADHPQFDQIHHEVFELVAGFSRDDSLQDQKAEFVSFLEQKGFQAADLLAAFDNNQFADSISRGRQLTALFEISGTPSLVAGHQYKVNNSALTSYGQLLDVTGELLER